MTEDGFAEIIEQDGAQLVLLPDEMRLPGTQVRVSRSGNGILLEPMVEKKSREEILAILAELGRLAEECGPFMPEGRQQAADARRRRMGVRRASADRADACRPGEARRVRGHSVHGERA